MGVSAAAAIDKLLKNKYRGDELDQAFRNEFVGYKLAEPQKRSFEGRQEIFPVQLSWGGQVAARPEMGSGALGGNAEHAGTPLPNPPVVENGAVDIKQMFGTLMWTKQAILRTKNNAGAFKQLVNFELQNMQDRFLKELNFHFFGDGRGRRATVVTGGELAAAVDSTLNLVLDTNRYLEVNDVIEVWTAADTARVAYAGGDATSAEEVFVSAKSDDGVTITIKRSGAAGDAATIAAGQFLRFFGEADLSGTAGARVDYGPVGISAAIDDGTLATTYAGISRTSYDRWKSFVKDAGGAILTESMITKCADAVHRKAGKRNRKINTLLMDSSIRRDYVQLTRPDRRYEGVSDLDAGWSDGNLVMTVGSEKFRLVEDMDTPFGKVFGLNKKDLETYIMQGVEIEQDAGGSMLKMGTPYGKAGTGHVYWAMISWYGNFAFTRPYGAFLLKNLDYELENE